MDVNTHIKPGRNLRKTRAGRGMRVDRDRYRHKMYLDCPRELICPDWKGIIFSLRCWADLVDQNLVPFNRLQIQSAMLSKTKFIGFWNGVPCYIDSYKMIRS